MAGIGGGLTRPVGHERPRHPLWNCAGPGLIPLKKGVHHTGPFRIRQEMGPETDQAAGRNDKLQVHPAASLVDQVDQPAFARRKLLGQNPDEFLRGIDEETLDRFENPLALLARDHMGFGNHELIPLAAHGLDQDSHLQFAPPAHLEGVGPLRRLHPERHILENLPLQPLLEVPGGEVFALPAGQRAVVHEKEHRNRRFVDTNPGQGLRILQRGDRVADLDILHTGKGNDVSRLDPLRRNLFQYHKGV